ncbi:hypothetical protein Godav_014350 [Gossypium davidsonii]|uniref:RNase H type-1 domain-containing protein n=1 Tax=Gossypium davidsonii TaxID=34287 RepID=A0A7J8RJU5_GOSDV|nr:hypothetical protein [Gossypium davidsonii]
MGRNRSYHEGLPQSVSNVVTFILLYLRELSFPGEGSRLCVGVPEVRWQPLVGPFVKVNFDASFLSHSRQSYSAIIVRNVESLVLEASIQMHSNVPNAFIRDCSGSLKKEHTGLETVLLILLFNIVFDGNRVAHHLAAMGVGQSLDQFWVEEVPLSVEPTVAADRWWVDLLD